MVIGIGVRLLLSSVDDSLEQISLALLGLWEAVVMQHSPDHYLAYALRILVDLFLTANPHRLIITLAWTAVGFVVAEMIRPTRRRRRLPSRKVPHVRAYHPPVTTVPVTSTNNQQRHAVTPSLDPNRPGSPPSFFLEGDESAINPNSPSFVPRYLPSALGSNESDSPPLDQILPTPPATLVTDGSREGDIRQYLPPIFEASEEGSASNEGSNHHQPRFHEHQLMFGQPRASFAPSVTTTAAPLTIPNPTMHHNNADIAQNEDHDDLYLPSVAPLPVPIPTTQRPATLSEPDELRTPNPANWELADQDELSTPIGPTTKLSPLFSDNGVLPDTPSAPIQMLDIPFDDPAASSSTPHAGPSGSAHTKPRPAVEYSSSQAIDKGSPEPDTDKLSEAESSLQTETDATSVISIRNSAQLYAVAELFRTKAREKEMDRVRLKQELSLAESEARIKDVLFLREDIRLAEIEARKLHERAVRRFYKGAFDMRFNINLHAENVMIVNWPFVLFSRVFSLQLETRPISHKQSTSMAFAWLKLFRWQKRPSARHTQVIIPMSSLSSVKACILKGANRF